MIHVACCCANFFIKFFETFRTNEGLSPFRPLSSLVPFRVWTMSNKAAKKREILSAASAAGMSVAFGAPIGGVLFSLEQVSYYFPDKVMWHSFVCAMIAAVSLQFMNPFRTGKLVLWQVAYERNWHDFELWSFVLIGIVGVSILPSLDLCNLALAKLTG